MAKQLTIFMENRPGRVNSVCDLLEEQGLNIWAFTIQDRGEFGLMKLIVDKPDKAQLALSDRGFACALKEVLAITAPDKPGNLDRLTSALLKKNVNIKDMYGFVSPNDRQGLCFMEFENPDEVDIAELIARYDFRVLTNEELYEL
ncbi:MAG TPA: acetolactate synthase [bacterium]|nr:acetolactate synthase [bacterium]